jgi:nucleoid-associated protein YgaU
LLYDTRQQDYIRAIYHYERYLELRPDAEKKKLIEDLIRQARLSFAASLPDQPPGAVEQIAMLKREIDALKGRLTYRQGGGGTAAAAKPATNQPAAAARANASALMPPKLAPAQPAVQTYIVQTRDTLSSIAAKLYTDPGKWKTIYDANRKTLSSPQSVRPGQTLIIPR